MRDASADEDDAPHHDVRPYNPADDGGEQGGCEGVLEELIREDTGHRLAGLYVELGYGTGLVPADDGVVVSILSDDEVELGAQGLGELNPT